MGGRRAYQVPAAFHGVGRLARLFTDAVGVGPAARAARLIPPSVRPKLARRFLDRAPVGVPPSRIRSAPLLGLRYAARLRMARTATDRTRIMCEVAVQFDRWVAGSHWGGAGAVYLFDGLGPRIVRRATADGVFAVAEQTIAPGEVQTALQREESAAFPGWEAGDDLPDDLVAECLAVQHQTWAGAGLIVCGSRFVADGIAQVGGPAERVVVVPYGCDLRRAAFDRPAHGGPLRVLTLGTVGLRKGTPYLLAAARRLGGAAQFRVVGSAGALSPAARRDLASAVEVVGAVPPGEIERHLAWADVFLLPTVCEGSAVSVFEALAAGLPVVTTPNAGSVVRDGVEGFVVPIRDVGAIAERITRLAAEPELRYHMGRAGRTAASEYTVNAYANKLVRTIAEYPARKRFRSGRTG